MNDACKQKIKIGHRANFRAKYKCFPQILFPVRAILRSINFRCTDFITDSADACILVMACVDCARACTLSSLLKEARNCARAIYTRHTKMHASAESVIKSVHRKLMMRKIARTGNKTCGKHLYLARKFAR